MGERLATIDVGQKSGVPLWKEMDPHITQCGLGRGLPAWQVSSWSIQLFGHNTPTSQTDRQDRQRSDSVGRTVLQTVAQTGGFRLRGDYVRGECPTSPHSYMGRGDRTTVFLPVLQCIHDVACSAAISDRQCRDCSCIVQYPVHMLLMREKCSAVVGQTQRPCNITSMVYISIVKPDQARTCLSTTHATVDCTRCAQVSLVLSPERKFATKKSERLRPKTKIDSRPSDHYFRSVCLFVCLFVGAVFLSRLWSDFDQTRIHVICLGLVVFPRIQGLCDPWELGDP